MSCSLHNAEVALVLDELHSLSETVDPPLLASAEGIVGAERAAIMRDALVPVDRNAGRLLYALVRSTTGTVVEFGTSFGISAIYIAAALRDRGSGKLITTELYEHKADKARGHIEKAGLSDLVEIRVGDATATLRDLNADVSVVFLDGMKQLYTPILQLLEPTLRPGALVVGDDT